MNFFSRVRRARPADAAAMIAVRAAMEENVVDDGLDAADIARALRRRCAGWIAEDSGGAAAGFCVADGRARAIWGLFVLPAHRRQGLGRLLLGQAVGWLAARGPGAIWLETSPGTAAERLYRAAGWAPAGLSPAGLLVLTCDPREIRDAA